MAQALKNGLFFTVGVALIAAIVLGLDMKSGGVVAASHIHHQFPECSKACHG